MSTIMNEESTDLNSIWCLSAFASIPKKAINVIQAANLDLVHTDAIPVMIISV